MKIDDRHEDAAVAAAASTPAGARGRVRLRLGDMLVAQHVLTPVQLKAALDEQYASGRKLGRILIEDGITNEATIARALAQQMKLPYVDLTLNQVQPAAAKLLPPRRQRGCARCRSPKKAPCCGWRWRTRPTTRPSTTCSRCSTARSTSSWSPSRA